MSNHDAANAGRSAGLPARAWLERLDAPDAEMHRALTRLYGSAPEIIAGRLALIRAVLRAFRERFGEAPARIFRSPARINLRGMHVDTHGGFLNLMTHQRETVVVAAPAEDGACVFHNLEAGFDEAVFNAEEGASAFAAPSWREYITSAGVRAAVAERKGSWSNYLRGAVFRARLHAGVGAPFHGLHAVVGSDIPRGAALSSSHALTVATLLAALRLNGHDLDKKSLILATQDAEWFTGARTGTSDQGAMILGGTNELVNVALYADDLDISGAQRLAFPKDLRVLVIDSKTERNLSGASLAAYTRNRLAYSLALEVLRQELRKQGRPEVETTRLDRLARITPEALGGARACFALLEHIPGHIAIDALRAHYVLPDFDAAYERYFGGVPVSERPSAIDLRGPLLFGLAESERARLFAGLIAAGDYADAGRLMTAGHDGDRVVARDGRPFARAVDDALLRRYAAADTPLALCPGDYGASSPALDALVDAALEGGALGASLTGAGIAGTVLALCRAEAAEAVADAVRRTLASPAYAAIRGAARARAEEDDLRAVVENAATAGVCEIEL